MRAPTVLAAIALTGTVLLGGAGQALAYDTDDMTGFGVDFGNSAPTASDFGKGAPGFDQSASASDKGTSGFDQGAPDFNQGASGLDQSASGSDQGASDFNQAGSAFDQPTGH